MLLYQILWLPCHLSPREASLWGQGHRGARTAVDQLTLFCLLSVQPLTQGNKWELLSFVLLFCIGRIQMLAKVVSWTTQQKVERPARSFHKQIPSRVTLLYTSVVSEKHEPDSELPSWRERIWCVVFCVSLKYTNSRSEVGKKKPQQWPKCSVSAGAMVPLSLIYTYQSQGSGSWSCAGKGKKCLCGRCVLSLCCVAQHCYVWGAFCGEGS